MSAEQELSRWKTINATRSINGLIEALKTMGPIEISGDRGAYDMAERVRQVHEEYAAVNMLTRNYGIRQQYIFLREATK